MKTRIKRCLFLPILLVAALSNVAYGGDSAVNNIRPEQQAETFTERQTTMIRIRTDDRTITATLIDSETTKDFVCLLPLTLTMDDLFGREKFGHLPRTISQGGKRTQTYEVGDVVYWSPGPDVAIFYRHDRQSIPPPGIIVLGNIESGMDVLNVPGSVMVTIDLVR